MASVSLLSGILFETDDDVEAKPWDHQVALIDQVFETDDEARPKARAKAEAKVRAKAEQPKASASPKPKAGANAVPKPDEIN